MLIRGGALEKTVLGWGVPAGIPVALAGISVSVVAGLAVAATTGLASTLAIAAIAVLGLTPLIVLLGRLALPAWVALFGVAYPFLRFPAEQPVVTFDRLFLGALLVGFVLNHARQTPARESAWLQRSLIALTAVFLVSAGSTAGETGLAIWIDAFLLPLAVFLCAREAALDRRQLISITGAMAIAGTSIAILGLAQRFAGLDLTALVESVARFDTAIKQVRISGPFPSPEPFALILLTCLAGTLFWIRARGPAVLLPGALAAGLQLVAIFLTYFRAAWLGAILILLVAFIAGKRSWAGRLGAIPVAVGAIALAFAAVGDTESVQTRLGEEGNIAVRIATYERSLDLFNRHPAFGVGFQAFDDALQEVPQPFARRSLRGVTTAHSSVVSTLAEQGLLGIVPLLAAAVSLALVLRALWLRAKDRIERGFATYATGAALAFLVMSATLTMIYYGPSNAMMALLAGLACGRLDALPRSTR